MMLQKAIKKIASGASLTCEESEVAFNLLMSGKATSSQISAFLMGLRVKGETSDEIYSGISVMRAKMIKVSSPPDAIDIVGTGGDASGSYNISTGAAIVSAGAGLKVAKHGNICISSKSGAADVLAALGVNLNIKPQMIAKCIREVGIGFMFAPNHHSAVSKVALVRKDLGIRTIFNLLGPLSNPACVKRQLVGVFSPDWLTSVTEALMKLGSETAWVVHGEGLDEISITGPTQISELKDGKIRRFEITPEDAGLSCHPMEAIRGKDPKYNASALHAVLKGEKNAYRDIILLNAAAAMIISQKTNNLRDGVKMAAHSIDCGAAFACLNNLVKFSNQIQ